ncbi:MAG: hypothetical protein ACOCZ5_02290 [bacterium]
MMIVVLTIMLIYSYLMNNPDKVLELLKKLDDDIYNDYGIEITGEESFKEVWDKINKKQGE